MDSIILTMGEVRLYNGSIINITYNIAIISLVNESHRGFFPNWVVVKILLNKIDNGVHK